MMTSLNAYSPRDDGKTTDSRNLAALELLKLLLGCA